MNHAKSDFFTSTPVNPSYEMGAYEWLWSQDTMTFKRISKFFRENPDKLPSELVLADQAERAYKRVCGIFKSANINDFSLRVFGEYQYPIRLRDAKNPIEFFYYRGHWDIAERSKSVAIVGARNSTDDGKRRTQKLTRQLVDMDFTIVSGLADGIDAVAHKTAIECNGQTIAVIGTPLSESYPKINASLQERIAKDYLLISQVPVLRYQQQDWRSNRGFFPERNKMMSALTQATIIVEASETSGTLIQARAALEQKRKLFILQSCFENPNINWPKRFEEKGAIRVRSIEDIANNL